jgi:hypothetical protein
MTAHPEVILGAFGEFETCPDRAPGMDTVRPSGSMMMKAESVQPQNGEFQFRLVWVPGVDGSASLARTPLA